MSGPVRIGAVLMASGAGSRFGSNKLLAEVEGTPLIQRAFSALPVALFDRAVVVSRHHDILVLAAQKGYHAFENPLAHLGQSVSITLGLAALEDMTGVLFAVCDQPWLTRASVRRLLAAFRTDPTRITALGWQGERGNPVIFPADLFPDLFSLEGDIGGGAVIRAHPDRLTVVEAHGADELRDVDRREDL